MSIYVTAAGILDKLDSKRGTIKSLCLADNVQDKKRTYALVCESLKYKEVISIIIQNTAILTQEKKHGLKPNLALVLIYDFLFGRGIQASGKFKEIIGRHKSRLQSELVRIKVKRKVKDNLDLVPDRIRNAVVLPRWVRINTLLTNKDQVIQTLLSMKFVESESLDDDNRQPNKSLTFRQDAHIPALLALPSNIDLHSNPLLIDGHIIIQDKASCFPAYILSPPRNSVVLDACAAPGNKTSHLSMVMENTGRIYAFDMDKRRLEILKKMTRKAGCRNIEPVLGSFLDADPTSQGYKDVEYILLDPSCSGSGIVGRMDHLLEAQEVEETKTASEETAMDRLTSLSTFQMKAIRHGLSFPSLKKLVYSTCSIHREENEDVVQSILDDPDVAENWELEKALPTWTRRGIPDSKVTEFVIRTNPAEDGCIGFFVALFVRKNRSERTKRRCDEDGDTHVSAEAPIGNEKTSDKLGSRPARKNKKQKRR
ncbi:putative 28S rRNA (cytosine-C(5))-methyltransferase [Gaertneriomyces sp. JEL0708]|nr:putative 28S rRNA (cytosine-C(5))-methyltransferase [Gaertneriomyces sp. JEL0708]